MKKIFLFLAVASMTAFTSCSSDDDSSGTPGITGIVLTSEVTALSVGESATLVVAESGKPSNVLTTAANTKIMAGSEEVIGGVFTPTTPGTYQVKATHKNSQNVTLESNVLTITVAAASPYKLDYNGTKIAVTAGDMIYWGAYYTDASQTDVVEIYALATHDGDLSTASPANLTFVDFTTAYNEAEMVLPTAGSYDWVAPFTALRELQLKVDGTPVTVDNFTSVKVTINSIEFAGGAVTMAYDTKAAFGGTSTSNSSGSGAGFLYDASGKAAAKGNNIEVFSAAKLNAKKAAFLASKVKTLKK